MMKKSSIFGITGVRARYRGVHERFSLSPLESVRFMVDVNEEESQQRHFEWTRNDSQG
jgi:hypothetical protein